MVSQWTREGKDKHVLGTVFSSVEPSDKGHSEKDDEPLNKGQLKAPCTIH